MTNKRLRIIFLSVGLLVLLGLAVLVRPSPPLYKVTVLPSLGGPYTFARAINDRGQVAGLSRDARGTLHLFLWSRAGGMQDLGLACNQLGDINNAGQIVGTLTDPNRSTRAVLWDPNGSSRFLTAPGVNSEARAINNLGQVVGVFEIPPGVVHAFIWDKANGMRDLGPGRGWTINDAGQVIVLAKGGPVIVDASRGDVTTGLQVPFRGLPRINNRGWVTGLSIPSATKPGMDVVLWHPHSPLKVLTQVRALSESNGGINDANQVLITDVSPAIKVLGKTIIPARVGCSLHDPHRGLVSLDRYLGAVPGSPCVMDLNNQGCIIAAVESRDGQRSTGVLLEPIPRRWGR